MDREASERRVADLYDAAVADWPGELDFYHALAAEVNSRGQPVLEVGCGTDRVASRIARAGYTVKAVYGDFARGPLNDSASELIWVTQTP